MHIHLLGISGTFMTGIALLAKQQGHQVTGMDRNIYPPMSDILVEQKIEVLSTYDEEALPAADLYVVGNVMSRGMPVVEKILNQDLPYISAPQWLSENVLRHRQVFAIAGTHGKTTTSALLAHMLTTDGRSPGYLIAGSANNFTLPATLGSGSEFVIEADEYDTAFFDKRAKFIHYHPTYLAITSLEYDHADIYENLAQIERQFCHLLRTIPTKGQVFYPIPNAHLEQLLEAECLAHRHRLLMSQHHANDTTNQPQEQTWWIKRDTNQATITREMAQGPATTVVDWYLAGEHNAANLLTAGAMARTAGVSDEAIKQAAATFEGVARRLDSIGVFNGVEIISDFAHHPTAIRASLAAVKERLHQAKLFAIVDVASHSMRMGVHKDLVDATEDADEVSWFISDPTRSTKTIQLFEDSRQSSGLFDDVDTLVDHLGKQAQAGDKILVMSNGAISKLLDTLMVRL